MQGSALGYGVLRDSPTMGIFKAGSGGITAPPTPPIPPDPPSGGGVLDSLDNPLLDSQGNQVEDSQ